jgi:hypothetical protein
MSVRTTMRALPAAKALAWGLLALLSVVLMVLALASGLVADVAERVACAGWAGAAAIRAPYLPTARPAGGGWR